MSRLVRNLFGKLRGARVCQTSKCSTAAENTVNETKILPIISTKNYDYSERLYQNVREVWLENMDTIEEKKLGIVTLHPDVYATAPRVDIIHENVKWQKLYRWVSYENARTRAETHHSGRKPWPQKGTGRARHGSMGSPLWKNGGKAHGPRSPTSHFYMLPFYTRIAGLTSSLSVKLAQDDLHLVDSLDIPTDESSYIEQLIEERNWGPSVLFVDSNDIMPQNIVLATDTIGHVNLMPMYSLNVYSMLKHDTLILTERAARSIEEKILFHLHRTDNRKFLEQFKINQQ